MGAKGIWRFVHCGALVQELPRPELPAINEPAALYLAASLDERKRLILAPEPVIRRLVELRWIERVTFTLARTHGVAWLDVNSIQKAFPQMEWKVARSSDPALDLFCSTVFDYVEARSSTCS